MNEAQLIHMLRSTRPYNYHATPEDIAHHKAAYIQWRYMVTRIADYLEDSDPKFTRLIFNQNIGVSGDFRIDLNATKEKTNETCMELPRQPAKRGPSRTAPL